MYQEQIEQLFSKQRKKQLVLAELHDESWFNSAVNKGVNLLQVYMNKEYENKEKQTRVNTLIEQLEDIEKIYNFVEKVLVTTVQNNVAIPVISVASMIHGIIYDLNKPQAMHTMTEIIVILANLDLYDTFVAKGQLSMRSRVTLDQETLNELSLLMYLPPMVEPPRIITKNKDNFYYSLEPETMILGGKINHHNENISLDVINKLSQQELSLDTDFIDKYKPQISGKTDIANWEIYLNQLEYVYRIIKDSSIWLTYKTDKRGRIYSQGYHCNPQGDDYHKAVIELAKQVIIQPGEYS